MKLIITLMHDEGEDKRRACTLAGSASVVLQYPNRGHVIVDAANVRIDAPRSAKPTEPETESDTDAD